MTAIERLQAIKTERETLSAEIGAINKKRGDLAAQLKALETAAAGDGNAVAAATAELAAALAAGDENAATEARNRVMAGQKAEAKASTRDAEINALRAAIAALDDKQRPHGLRINELHRMEKALAGERLDELAGDLDSRWRAQAQEMAAILAEAQALGIVSANIDYDKTFAPMPFAVPSFQTIGIGGSGQIAIDLSPMRQEAVKTISARLRAEGFRAAV